MKTLKNDSRYILKKIIIGVCIALILAFINKNNVFADEVNICLSGSSLSCNENQNKVNFSFKSPYSNNNYNFKGTGSNVPYITMYDNITNSYYTAYFYGNSSYYNVDLFNIKMITTYSGSTRTVWYGYKCNDLEDSSCQDGYKLIGGFQNSFVLSNNNNLDYSTWNDFSFSISVNILNSPIPNEYFYVANTNNILSNDFVYDNFSNFEVYSSNLYSFSIEDNEIYDGSSIIPSGYSEINLTGNDAVYFVPKNYNDIDTSIIDNKAFVNFPFYYKGNIKTGYFDMMNTNLMVLPNSYLTSSDYTDFQGIFPTYYDTKALNNEDLTSYIIFNQSKDTSSYIMYDSNLFDYYLVSDINTYKETINIVDPEDNSESITIYFVLDLENYWSEGFTSGGDTFSEDSLSNNGGASELLDSILNLLQSPFNFLRNLSRNNCSSISLPIPFVNGNLSLECLSSRFKSTLGETFYNIIFTIISALYAYRITILNIDSITDILNPSDDKLEVVDL